MDYWTLLAHAGHRVSLHTYNNNESGRHVTLECEDCGAELHSEHAPENENERPEFPSYIGWDGQEHGEF